LLVQTILAVELVRVKGYLAMWPRACSTGTSVDSGQSPATPQVRPVAAVRSACDLPIVLAERPKILCSVAKVVPSVERHDHERREKEDADDAV
jgi:hypothetical protein